MTSWLAAVVAGVSAGMARASSGEAHPEPPADAKHVCQGLNACKGQGGCKHGCSGHGCQGRNDCKGKGGCAAKAADHACAGKNTCKGLGGCASGDQGCGGKNSCKGHGGCEVPMKVEHATARKAHADNKP